MIKYNFVIVFCLFACSGFTSSLWSQSNNEKDYGSLEKGFLQLFDTDNKITLFLGDSKVKRGKLDLFYNGAPRASLSIQP